MKIDKTDNIVESYIAEAFVRKGEQETIDELKKIDSADELRQLLGNVEMKHHRVLRSSASSRIGVTLAAVAAVVAVVLIVGFQPRYSTEELYGQWYERPTYEPSVSRGGQEIDSTQKAMLDKAGMLYESGDLVQAISLYGEAATTAPDMITDEALFYWAATLAQTAKTDDAITKFSQLVADSNSEYSQEAAWQLALVYLKIGARKKAIPILENIALDSSYYKNDAIQLLKEVRQKRLF